MNNKTVVLYIDDEFLNLSAFEILFRNKFTVFTTPKPEKALEIINKEKVNVVIADQKMPVMTGVELMKKIIELDSSILRIIHSGYIDDSEIKQALDDGTAHAILDKPLNKSKMFKVIDEFMEVKSL